MSDKISFSGVALLMRRMTINFQWKALIKFLSYSNTQAQFLWNITQCDFGRWQDLCTKIGYEESVREKDRNWKKKKDLLMPTARKPKASCSKRLIHGMQCLILQIWMMMKQHSIVCSVIVLNSSNANGGRRATLSLSLSLVVYGFSLHWLLILNDFRNQFIASTIY